VRLARWLDYGENSRTAFDVVDDCGEADLQSCLCQPSRAMEISLPNGAKVSLDADVDAEALRRVLLALGVA
jgi:hypothetical protein